MLRPKPVAAVLAFPIQAAGAELLKEALGLLMPRLWSELPGVRFCHVVHDEILLEAPEALAQAAADLLLQVMQDPGLQTHHLRHVLPLVTVVAALLTASISGHHQRSKLANSTQSGQGPCSPGSREVFRATQTA